MCDQNVKKPGGGRTEVRTKEEEGGGEEMRRQRLHLKYQNAD